MEVSVERYTRKKYMGQADSPTLFYLRQKTGTVRILSTRELADEIQDNTALKRGEVTHMLEAFIDVIRRNLANGNKVRLDGLGLFHMTITCNGSEKEEDCTVKNIRRVNIRFVPDKEIKLVNASHLATRSPNVVDFALYSKDKNPSGGAGGEEGGGGDIIDPTA